MAILCLASSLHDLKERLSKIIVAYDYNGKPVTAGQIKAHGAMAALLKDAVKPNLVQTLENVPAIIHGGPFGGGQYRPRLQQRGRHQGRSAAGGLCGDGGGLRR